MTNALKIQSLQSRGSLLFKSFGKSSVFENFKKLPIFKSKKIVIISVAVLLAIAAVFIYKAKLATDNVSEATYVAEGPKAQLNRRFDVPIKDAQGKEVGSALVVNVTYLERTEELIYKGRRLFSKEGKDFIVINLEVENSTENRLTVRPVDFFRLIDESGKSYAPDIQTDPVKVEPKSSKRTRTIYIVGDDQKILKFMIGEIKGGNVETVEVAI